MPKGNKKNATVDNPVIGFCTLTYMEGLKESYWDTTNRMKEVSGLTRIYNSERIRKLKKLNAYRNQIESEFKTWSARVKEWVSKFQEKDVLYGDIVIEYYCNINNYVAGKGSPIGALTLQDILDEYLCEETDKNKRANMFKAKIRTIALKLIEAQE